MTQLLWGSRIVRIIREIQGGGQTVVIVRHSERPSFDNLPRHRWDSVELTRTGVEVATAFGAALGGEPTIKRLRTFGWGLKRSHLTSQAISEGARQAGCHVLGPSSLELKSPIANHEEYEKALASGQWDRFVSDWLNGNDPQGVLVPARQYAKEIYQSLLGADLCVPNATTVIATHDLHILPLSRYFLTSSPSGVDYLDGVVLKVNRDQVKIGFNAKVVSVQLKELSHSNSDVNEKGEGQLPHSE